MQPIPRTLADKFAKAFADQKVGFSAKEITDYFTKYSNLVRPYDHYGMNPTRLQLFIDAVYALPPKQQYYALNDLSFIEYKSKYAYPSEAVRLKLREELHTFISPTPIGLGYSKVRETAFREDWVVAQSRVYTNPAAAITAGRTMLETLLKTIVTERGQTPHGDGNLSKLMKQAENVLGFDSATQQEEHMVFTGLASVINGIATLSNDAGDRHGTISGKSIDDPYFANLVINAAGTLGLAFIEMHMFNQSSV